MHSAFEELIAAFGNQQANHERIHEGVPSKRLYGGSNR